MERTADWLKQAERDLKAGQSSVAAGFHEWAAFAAQQSAEKALQALVQSTHGVARGHSQTGIFRHLSRPAEIPSGILDAARELDQVYVTSRYPNGFVSGSPGDCFSERTSERLLNHAEAILEFCRSQISGS